MKLCKLPCSSRESSWSAPQGRPDSLIYAPERGFVLSKLSIEDLRRMRSVMSLLMGGNDNAQPLPRLENRCRCYWNFHTPTTIEMLLSVGHCQAKIFRSNHNGKTRSWNAMGESSTPPFRNRPRFGKRRRSISSESCFWPDLEPDLVHLLFRDVPFLSLIAANRVHASPRHFDPLFSETMNRNRPDFPAGGSVM